MNITSNTKLIGKVFHYFREIESTNSYAAELIAKNAPTEGTVILAANQRAGRGQQGALWDSAAGKNVLMSVILKPSWIKPTEQFYLNMAISLAVQEVVQALTEKETVIKWPNDILIDEQKVAGILIENTLQEGRINYSIVGIGLNVNQVFFPEQVKRATSLMQVTGREFELNLVLKQLLERLERFYELLHAKAYAKIRAAYLQKLFRYQEIGRYKLNGNEVEGQLLGVNALGKLVLQIGEGLMAFDTKEIEYIYTSE